jgi:hypothetical protein
LEKPNPLGILQCTRQETWAAAKAAFADLSAARAEAEKELRACEAQVAQAATAIVLAAGVKRD